MKSSKIVDKIFEYEIISTVNSSEEGGKDEENNLYEIGSFIFIILSSFLNGK
jgi:hypothetical protein